MAQPKNFPQYYFGLVLLFVGIGHASAAPPSAPGLVAPANGASQIPLPPQLQVSVSDPDSDPLTVNFYGRELNQPGEDFTIIAMPDTQHYTDGVGSAATFQAQTQWIVANREALNIVFVTGLGDIVQNGSGAGNDAEWLIAHAAYSFLENPLTTLLTDGIPFGLAVGNHDQSPIGGGDTASTLKYNQYFGESRFLGRTYYGGHYAPAGDTSNNDNSYQLFSAGGMEFIIIHFEYDTTPLQAVLDWADALLTAHSNRRAILTTHYMIEIGNPAAWGNQGLAIYEALKDHPNLFLMLGGHRHGEGRRQDITPNGNTVNTLLSDYQDYPNGGNGFLRIMTFSPANNTISVKTYSPTLEQFEVDDSSQFMLAYPMDGLGDFELLDSQSNIPSGESVASTWEGLEWSTAYEWFVRVDDGNGPFTDGPVWTFTTQPQPPATVPPDTQILSAPAAYTDLADASFSFTGSDNLTAPGDLDFECRLDQGAFVACTSPQVYTSLAEGNHQFEVRAIDADHNSDPSPASHSWEIDFTPTYRLQRRITASLDDAEENLANGSVDTSSTDLEMVLDTGANPDKNQLVGMRFSAVDVPRGATVLDAWIEFETDETSSVATALVVQGQASDDAPPFSSSANNISSRSRSSASIPWNPPAWTGVNDRHRTPDLSTIVQDVTSRSGWQAGNALVFLVSGSGQRVAESFDGEPGNAPQLVIEYSTLSLHSKTFQQGSDGYSGTVDTYLAVNAPTANNSAATTLVVDRNSENHILLRFDALVGGQGGQIPPGSLVVSARLDIMVSNESNQGALLHRMLLPWQDSDSWNSWGGGIQANGIEARALADSSHTGSEVGMASIDVSKDIQAWVDGEVNHGWAWLPPAGDNSWQFNSSEGAVPPRLSIFYLPPEWVFGDGFE